MAKIEVILTKQIVGLGAESDQVKVAAGYARNYLYPQGIAIPLSGSNKRRLEVLRQRRAEREAHEFNTMSELAKSITKLTCLIKVKTGDDGKMFGSVTNGTIADGLKHQFDISLDKKKIHLDQPIKATGDYEVDLRLHQEVHAKLKVRVESTTPPPAPAEAPEPKAGEKPTGTRTEKRGHRPEGKAGAPAGEVRTAAGEGKSDRPRTPRPPRADKPARPSGPEKSK